MTCGIYQLICPTCNMKYIGRFQEHFRDFKYRNNKFTFAHNLLENGHCIGPIEDIMDTIHVTNKGCLMDPLERFYCTFSEKRNLEIKSTTNLM